MKKIVLFFLVSIVVGAVSFWAWLPTSREIKGCLKTSMYDVDLCPGSKSYVPLNSISKNVQNAILITEDSGFYQHKGFDQEGIQRCIEKLKEKMRIVCGGSTITQQLAKNMFLYKEKDFIRKGLEAIITVRIEDTLTKKEILERYLNVVQFGKNIFGIKQAAQFYFKKHPSQLSVHEAAFLAMVLPNPEKYSQSFYKKNLTRFARKRLSQIIGNMHRYHRISGDDYVVAMDQLDIFLKGAQAIQPPKVEQPEPQADEELTEEDLELMAEQQI